MDKRLQMYKLLQKQNSRMFIKAILYYIFTPFLIPLSLFCLTQIGQIIKIICNNFKNATNIFRNTIAPKSYLPLKVYCGEYDDVTNYFSEKGIGIFITPNFLLIKTKSSFDIIPKKSVVWLYYRHETSLLVYGHGGTNMQTTIDYSAMVCTELGKIYQAKISQSNIGITTKYNRLNSGASIEEVACSLPNAVLGYSKELERLYKNNPRTFLEKNGIIKENQ